MSYDFISLLTASPPEANEIPGIK